MQYGCSTVDGSAGHTIGRGYPTFACIAYGLASKTQIPLCHHLYSTVDPDFKSPWVTQQHCLGWMAPFFTSPNDRIVVADRGEDDEKRFIYYMKELHCSFLTRINTGINSRKLHLVRSGEISDEAISVQHIAAQMQGVAGAARQWKNKKIQKTLHSRIAFQEVRLPGHQGIPLFLVLLYTEGFEDPIVLLSDMVVENSEKAWEVFFWYKKRWEVENFFRAIKQEFAAEQFLIRSFPAIRALLFVQMLAFSLLRQMHRMAEEIFVTLLVAFKAFCFAWQRSKESHIDLLHWIRDAWKKSRCRDTISYRRWSRLMRKRLCMEPEKSAEIFSPPGKW